MVEQLSGRLNVGFGLALLARNIQHISFVTSGDDEISFRKVLQSRGRPLPLDELPSVTSRGLEMQS